MFKRRDVTAIGKVYIDDLDKIKSWLLSKEGRYYIANNWSKARNELFANNWDDTQVGFYNLQSVIPAFHEAERIYNKLEEPQDKKWLERHVEDIIRGLSDTMEYFARHNLTFDLIWDGGSYVVFCAQNDVWLFPASLIRVEKYKNYDNIPIHQLKSLSGPQHSASLIPAGMDISVSSVKSEMDEQKNKIEDAKAELKRLEDEQEEKLEEMRRQIQAIYKEQMDLIADKKAELEEMVKTLETQLFLLDTEIYAIRAYNGEVINFSKIVDGSKAPADTPFIIYQKIRFLDAELSKHAAIYDMGDYDEDMELFEDVLKHRADIRDLFLPTEKCCTLVRLSESGYIYSADPIFANMLEKYDKRHGHTLGILIRNGQQVYIAWTDEDRVEISGADAFMKNESKVEQADEHDYSSRSRKEDVASRYFLFATLQGVIDHTDITDVPKHTSILQPSSHVILSMADGWIEDTRFGTFMEILEKTNRPLKKGDMVLTTMKIERDDARNYGPNSTRYRAYCNDRGRGEKNRTHDVALRSFTIYPVNLVEKDDVYETKELRTFYKGRFVVTEEIKKENYTSRRGYDEYTPYPEMEEQIVADTLFAENGYRYGINLEGKTSEELTQLLNDWYHKNYNDYYNVMHGRFTEEGETIAYKERYVSVEYSHSEYRYYISEEKQDGRWRSDVKRMARANLQFYPEECINLTFLNSIWIKYAIQNRQVGQWKVGSKVLDYATSIKYLNRVLEYLNKREETEAALISKYMELPNEWQVVLSEWKLENDVHTLTDTKAKKFAREYENMQLHGKE